MEINESPCLHVRDFDFPYIEILIVTKHHKNKEEQV